MTARALRLTFVLFFVALSFAPLAHAATGDFFGPIIPPQCNCSMETTGSVPSAPGFACVLATVQNSVSLAIAIAFVIMTFFIAWSGWLYMTSAGSPGNREKANHMLTNAIVGILIALSSWLIIDFLMQKLYNPTGHFKPWNSILTGGDTCIVPTQPHQIDGLPGVISNTISGTETSTELPPNTASGDGNAVRAQLSAAHITVNKAECPGGVAYTAVSGGCTSVGGLGSNTIAQAINIRNFVCGSNTGCTIQITGGSEAGHSTNGTFTHGNGYKIDIHITSEVDAKLKTFADAGSRGGDSGSTPLYKDKCGNVYAREGDHWDIQIKYVCTL
jgi:hypothetical protein